MLQNLIRSTLIIFLLSGCADENFYQQDALSAKSRPVHGQPVQQDSVWIVPGSHYNRGGFFRFFWGSHYRDIWNTPVKVEVLDMGKVEGGLTVLKTGGGYQTTSFQLQDSTGRHYAFRSIDKDPVHVLPEFWQKTFVANIVRDQTSASNPYGMLVVPGLANAAGVFHTNPRLFYVQPQDTSFGEHADRVQGRVFMLEEKYKKAVNLPPLLAHVDDFMSTEDALRLRFTSNRYHFDQQAFARARLLDLLIGDWDRHKGQWDWAVLPQNGETIFAPIPKDRDQVFLNMKDGLIPFIATSKLFVRKFNSFSRNIDDVQALMINARFIDERLLNELSAAEWQEIAQDMQKRLTDEAIENAVRKLPPPIYNIQGKEITENLKSRRNQLQEAAATMYKILAKEVTVPGTDEAEFFLVNRLNNQQTQVQVFRPGTRTIIYNRVFNRDETERIVLHGLRGEDIFVVEGNVDKGILVEIYGGMGEDQITDRSRVGNWKKMTHIYDTKRGNEIDFGTEARDRTTRDVSVHVYDQEGN